MRSSPIPFAMLGLGIIIGAGLMMAAMPVPMQDIKCQTYGVSHKVATAYVLRPPPAEIRYEACPQTTKVEPCVLPKAENDTQPDLSVTDKTQKTRRHMRHHRVRRYWR